MRTPIVIGNWKMHGLSESANHLATNICAGINNQWNIEIALLPPFVHLPMVSNVLRGSKLAWGGQNAYVGHNSAVTGEISAAMLADLGCSYVLVGHSERRKFFHEDSWLISKKIIHLIENGLHPILCLGEQLEDKKSGLSEEVIAKQLQEVIEYTGIGVFNNIIIAYEPVWAIGTGLSATPDEAQAIHSYIRRVLAKSSVDIAQKTRIIYGGSIKAENAEGLFMMQNVDGGLVGGAALDAQEFLAICCCAHNVTIK